MSARDANPGATRKPGFSSFTSALLATALFRCWHITLFFAGWATLWTCLFKFKITPTIGISTTLLTVIGTVIGFVISYRTTSSFERYNEGRKLWSQIVLASRTFARFTWFHVPDATSATVGFEKYSPAQIRARTIIEKKSVINLVEAFAVAVKHYLRGEQGVHYADLYPLVKSLPPYALPGTIPSPVVDADADADDTMVDNTARSSDDTNDKENGSAQVLPLPVTSPRVRRGEPPKSAKSDVFFHASGEPKLLPARNPPNRSLWDLFPFSIASSFLTKRGFNVGGKKAARLRAKLGHGANGSIISHNVPLEITLYLSSYIAALQTRKVADVATHNGLINSLNSLVDALTGLERILTTPIPFSYSFHLWLVTGLYCLALPFQLVVTLGWVAIPGTTLAAFAFFGFIVAGEEIENPFGYDKNDLDMDHFTHNIIRLELKAITANPVPDPSIWAFSGSNDEIFEGGQHLKPEEWAQKGESAMRKALTINVGHDAIDG